MRLKLDNDRPIFLQIKEIIEDAIITGEFAPDDQIPSNSQLVTLLNVNPVTVHKGVSLLLEEGTIYKKRGLGMFVSPEAPALLRKAQQKSFKEESLKALVDRAQLLGLTKAELKKLIDEEWF